MDGETRAPRFRAHLQHYMGALVMPREDWEALVEDRNAPIQIDVRETPMASVSAAAQVVGTFAERTEDGRMTLSIVRVDPKDAPQRINVDKYSVLDDVPAQIDYHRLVVSSSTSDDSQLRGFLADYVLIVPADKSSDHHLTEMPAIYRAVIEE